MRNHVLNSHEVRLERKGDELLSRLEELGRKGWRPAVIKVIDDHKKLLTEKIQEIIQLKTKYNAQKEKDLAFLKSVRNNLALKLEEIRLTKESHNS